MATEAATVGGFLVGEECDPGLAKTGGACNCWVSKLLAAVKDVAEAVGVTEVELFIPLNRSKTLLRLFLLTLVMPELVLLLLALEVANEGFRRLEVGLGAILGKELPAIW